MPEDQVNYSMPVAARVAAARGLLQQLHERQSTVSAPYVPVEVLAILDVVVEVVEELAANKWTSGSVR